MVSLLFRASASCRGNRVTGRVVCWCICVHFNWFIRWLAKREQQHQQRKGCTVRSWSAQSGTTQDHRLLIASQHHGKTRGPTGGPWPHTVRCALLIQMTNRPAMRREPRPTSHPPRTIPQNDPATFSPAGSGLMEESSLAEEEGQGRRGRVTGSGAT